MGSGSGMERSIRRIKRRCKRYLRKARKREFYPLYGALLLISLWWLIFPSSFSDFVWTYFWGPVLADAAGHPVGGIHEGYNPVNTLTYGLVLVALVYYSRRQLRKRRLCFDAATLVSLVPLIVAGALSRVLEDGGAFSGPVAYMFISPFIYLWTGSLALFFLLFASFLEKKPDFEALVLGVVPYPFALKFLWYPMRNEMPGTALFFFIGMAILFMAFHFYQVRKKGFEMASAVLLYSSYVLTIFVFYAFQSFDALPNAPVIPLVLGISLISTIATGALSRYRILPEYFSEHMNLAIIFSHSMDGAATWIGIDYYGYGEKHVLAGFLTAHYGGLAFFLSKIAISLLVVYLLDSAFKKELKNDSLKNLIKFIIIFLGLGPGIRDMLRISLGT